jgi:hypothetical protein
MIIEYDKMVSVGWVGLSMTMTDRKVEGREVSRRQNKKKKGIPKHIPTPTSIFIWRFHHITLH